ncbi:MAG TPA: hypothetical protein VM580_06550, partial [Labilithrix sp.]|nr:hypothetical protein [Labilithrix sp.]
MSDSSKGQQPAAPTSGSWRRDAEALLEIGAKMIDAATVRGLLDETRLDWSRPDLEAHRVKSENSVTYTIHGHKIRVVNSADLNAIERAMEAVRDDERRACEKWLEEDATDGDRADVAFCGVPFPVDKIAVHRSGARLDADGTAKPKTEIVAVMPESAADEWGFVHEAQATHYVVRPTKQTSERAVRFAKAQSRVVDQYSDTFAKLAEARVPEPLAASTPKATKKTELKAKFREMAEAVGELPTGLLAASCDCTDVIPGTFIACGEGGNYCSEGCEERQESARVDEILEVITTRSTPLTHADIDRICL